MFNEQKVTEMATYLLSKANGHEHHLKLMKLLYLSERKSYEMHGCPMSDDKLVSMRLGPVMSNTLDLISGSSSGAWEKSIESISDHRVMIRGESTQDYKLLSRSDKDILDDIWQEFGAMERFDLCDWTHENCPEWKDPNGSVLPIKTESLLSVLEYTKEDQLAILEEQQADNNLADILAQI